MITITDKEFKLLTEYIQRQFGIYLKPEKRALLCGRLQHVLMELNFHSFTEYYKTAAAAKVQFNKNSSPFDRRVKTKKQVLWMALM